MKNLEKFDIGIIGGGPAGSSAALLLSRARFNVCLFEKKNFPRETVCGEFLSREVYKFLAENGLEKQFLSLNPNPINSFKIFFGNNISIKSDLDFIGYGLKRSTFDLFLLNEAVISGTKVFQPVNVFDIIKNQNEYIIKFSINNQECSIVCNNVIAAYGKQNILDKKLNRNFIEKKSKINGVKYHFNICELPGFNKNEIHIYSADSIYCGVNAVNDNMVTVCFLEDRNKFNISSRDHLRYLISQNSGLSEIISENFERLMDINPIYGTGNIYFGNREIVKDGILMSGDAGQVIAPLAGDGISMALQNARLLTYILELKRMNNLDSKKTQLTYISLWKKEFRKRLFIASFIQKILFSKYLSVMSGRIAAIYPGIIRFMINATRG